MTTIINRIIKEDDDERILKDGKRLSAPLTAADHRSVLLMDRDEMMKHWPHYFVDQDEEENGDDEEQESPRRRKQRDAVDLQARFEDAVRDAEAAHASHIDYLNNAWKGPQRDMHSDVSVPDQPRSRTDAMTMEQLYAEYARTVENAWRTP